MRRRKVRARPPARRAERGQNVERQYRHACEKCGQVVAYQSRPHDEELKLLYLVEAAVRIPWHHQKTPWVCRVCSYVCRSQEHLDAHKKQRQHFWDKEEEGPGATEKTG